MTRDALLQEVLQLPTEDRAGFAADLLASLEEAPLEDPEDVAQAWGEEIERRARRVLAGASSGRPWDEVRKDIEARLTKP